MGRFVREWVTEARCVDCGGIYDIDPRYPLKQRCKPCYKAMKKRVKRTNSVQIVSFLFFPLGILMYFLWKDKKPYFAKSALKAALIPIYIFGGILLLDIIIKLILI